MKRYEEKEIKWLTGKPGGLFLVRRSGTLRRARVLQSILFFVLMASILFITLFLKFTAMLTIKHIEIYKLYYGDGDGFVRCASDEEKAYMTYKYWSLIDDFLQDIYLVKKGLASKIFSDNLCKKLHEKCDSQETINKLTSLDVARRHAELEASLLTCNKTKLDRDKDKKDI